MMNKGVIIFALLKPVKNAYYIDDALKTACITLDKQNKAYCSLYLLLTRESEKCQIVYTYFSKNSNH